MARNSSQEDFPTVSNNVGDALEMSAADMLREIGGVGRTKNVIDRAAKLCGITYWRAFDIVYNKVRHIEPEELGRIRDTLKAQREVRTKISNLEYRIARLERILDRQVAERDRAHPDLFGNVVHSGG